MSATGSLTPLTRRDFFRLTERCRTYATELAHYEQSRVNLRQCYQFNAWLPELKAYDLLAPALRTLRPAWPVARWQVLILLGVLGLVITSLLAPRWGRTVQTSFFYSYCFALFLFYFVPERLYGTTIELLEGKVLRIVETLDSLLTDGKLDFTEAAYFQAKENLEAARRELRQQIDLAHR
jgi:hypothetical protein